MDRCGVTTLHSACKTAYDTVNYRNLGPVSRRYDQQALPLEYRKQSQLQQHPQQHQQQQQQRNRRSASYASRSLPRRPAPRRIEGALEMGGAINYETLAVTKCCRKGANGNYRDDIEAGGFGRDGVASMDFDDLPVGGYAAATLGRGRSRHAEGRGKTRRASASRARSVGENTSSQNNHRLPLVEPIEHMPGRGGVDAGVKLASANRRSRSRSTEASSTRSEAERNISKPAAL